MKEERNKKNSLKEIFSDRKKKAKFELLCYGIFFLILIIFIRVSNFISSSNIKDNTNEILFTENINDNYAYDILLTIDDNNYHYYGKILGHNGTIFLDDNDSIVKYYIINDKYYSMKDDNYILEDINKIFPYFDYEYLNVNKIKEYLNNSIKENDSYKIIISDLNELYSDVKVDNENTTLEIDYTNLFNEYNKVLVKMHFSNINKIITLEEEKGV